MTDCVTPGSAIARTPDSVIEATVNPASPGLFVTEPSMVAAAELPVRLTVPAVFVRSLATVKPPSIARTALASSTVNASTVNVSVDAIVTL